MPRVHGLRFKYRLDDLHRFVDGQMHQHKMNQSQLGQELGHSQQVMSNRLKHNQMSIEDLMRVIELYDIDVETIGKLLKGGK